MPPPDNADIRVLGAPQRIVVASQASRLRRDPLGVDVVENGVIPRTVDCEIPIFDTASDWKFTGWKGGVYDRNGEVCPASLHERDFTRVSTSFAPDEIGAVEHIPGEAVYAGLAFKHFGHFLLESTNRLWWPVLERFDGPIVFQNTIGRERVPRWAQTFFDLLGWRDRIMIVDHAVSFDRVIVPHSAFTIRKMVHETFRAPFRAAGAAAERHARAVSDLVSQDATGAYLSRTRYGYRQSHGEQRMEKAFARNDFDVFHMEELPFEQQILVMRRYGTVAGIAGSAFHTMLFCDDAKTAIYVNRDHDVNENFFMIDELMGNRATYLYNPDAESAELPITDRAAIVDAYHADTTLDVKKLFSLLDGSGALSSPWRWRGY
jgi:capsular polysaccharide biosynthesis protein